MPSDDLLRLYPLGGLGEVGMNCLALDTGQDVLVVDCGIKFPERSLGADVIHPDFTWLESVRDRVRAVVLTHGHEDHIGALPYLLRRMNVPVYGPPYALTLAKDRLSEFKNEVRKPDLRAIAPGEVHTFGAFSVEPIRVTHSIAEATSLLIGTPVGNILHTGDFKIDPASPDGAVFDEPRFRRAGDEGIRLLLSDSTNAWVPGSTGSESEVAEALAQSVARVTNLAVATIFASNVHRLIALFDAAAKTHRRVCLLGRSVRKHVSTAMEHGHLRDVRHMMIAPDEVASFPRNKVLIVATGTQGEERAALARLGRGIHPQVKLMEGDTVILSSRVIPGNERTVNRMLNDLMRAGIEVELPLVDRGLHVSGHAHSDEQRRMLEFTRPKGFVPVHGTLFHLRRHAALAESLGVSETLVVENGTSIELTADALRAGPTFPSGIVHVNGPFEVDDVVLDERSELAAAGFASVTVTLDDRGEVIGLPAVVGMGVSAPDTLDDLFDDAADFVADEIERMPKRERTPEEVREVARTALRRYLGRRVGTKPLTDAVVIEQ
ncbi:MAG: ribonuclease J [Polyangiales bacterium]